MSLRPAAIVIVCAIIAPALGHDSRPADSGPTGPVPSPLKLAVTPAPHAGSAALSLDVEAYAVLRDRPTLQLGDFILSDGRVVDLSLTRVEVFSDEARIVVGHPGRELGRPDVAVFHGLIADEPGSSVFLSLSPHGVQGWVREDDATHVISSGRHGSGDPILVFNPALVPADLLQSRPWTCGADDLTGYANRVKEVGALRPEGGAAGVIVAPSCRVAQVAIETDHEFTASLFGGNTDAAAAYAATLIAAASEIFISDVNTRLDVVFLRLWESPDDPWNAGGTGAQLEQFQQFWINNMGDVQRTVAHFLSGRGLGGGVAWLGSLCDPSFGYAVSANLGGFFPYPLVDHDGGNWDIMVVAHELGHNFGTPHTHDFNPPVDGCAFGQCANAFDVGTIMSYCHTCPGGLANIALTLHPVPSEAILSYLDSNTACNLFAFAGAPVAVDDAAVAVPGAVATMSALANDVAANCDPIHLVSVQPVTEKGGTVEVSVGTGIGGLDQFIYMPAAGFTGDDAFTYTIADDFGQEAIGTVNIDVIELRAADNPTLTNPGVNVDYFHLVDPVVLPDFTQLSPYASQVEAQVNFPSTGGLFAGSGEFDNFGAVYTGYVAVAGPDVYTFYVNSDDGSKLFIGDDLVVNNDGLHPMVEIAGSIGLMPGLHEVRVEFFERGGGAGVIVSVAGGGLAKHVVPAADWFHEGSADLTGDGVVDGADLGELLLAWGTCAGAGGGACPPADLNLDGTVDGEDLGLLLLTWS